MFVCGVEDSIKLYTHHPCGLRSRLAGIFLHGFDPSIDPSLYCETITTTIINRCGPCRLTVPVVKDVMKQYSGELEVVEVCTDDLAEVAEDAGVVSIPTIQFYYDGAALETHSIVGCVAKSVLSNAVQKVIEDVAQIRK